MNVLLGIAIGLALGLLIANTIMCFDLAARVRKTTGPDGAWLRVDGSTLHGRIVFVDRIGWEREIARWGLTSNGVLDFKWPSDHTLYTGYVIEGPDDVPAEYRTASHAPFREKLAPVLRDEPDSDPNCGGVEGGAFPQGETGAA